MKKFPKIKLPKLKHIIYSLKICFWFTTGAFLSLFFVSTSLFLIFEKINTNKIYPGIIVNGVNLGGKDKDTVKNFYIKKNEDTRNTTIVFLHDKNPVATTSAKDINLGYDEDLISTQAYSIGRSKNILTNVYLISKAYLTGVYLPPAYKYSENELNEVLNPFTKSFEKTPIDALFKFENGRVAAFRASENGRAINRELLDKNLRIESRKVVNLKPDKINLELPIKVLEPSVTTESVNKFGIKELIGVGRSTFHHSIPGRIHNITLAASRISGTLVKPGDIFSFANTLGDVSAFTGYQQAYIIKEGKTVLGDGGGVCQVSTTFFRALLNAGLSITERHPHSYRVGYYEQDSLPGLDATIYVPSVDLRFKNDTGNYILIQSEVDLENLALTFYLYGTKDGREVTMSKPTIASQTPPPPPLYQDDPTLQKDVVKQVDFEAWGAKVSFTREVKKDGKVIIFDKFDSNYQPWQAVYLRGTKEN